MHLIQDKLSKEFSFYHFNKTMSLLWPRVPDTLLGTGVDAWSTVTQGKVADSVPSTEPVPLTSPGCLGGAGCLCMLPAGLHASPFHKELCPHPSAPTQAEQK